MKRIALVVAALLAVPAAARADEKDPCINAYTDTQSRRKDGKLIQAAKEARTCAKAECPAMLAKDCRKWQTEIEAATPSVLVEARSESGAEVASVRVIVDGIAAGDGSAAIPVDPGARVVRVDAPGHVAVEQTVTLREGEKDRRVAVVLVRDAAPAKAAAPVPLGVWIFGGASVAALAVSSVFALDGLSRKSDLDGCKPTCAAADVDAMNARFTMADVALGAGVMAGLAAVWLYVTRPRGEAPSAASAAWPLRF